MVDDKLMKSRQASLSHYLSKQTQQNDLTQNMSMPMMMRESQTSSLMLSSPMTGRSSSQNNQMTFYEKDGKEGDAVMSILDFTGYKSG